MIAASWAEVPSGCICKWNAPSSGSWSRAEPNPRCLAEHGEDG